jgi:hypothetical protein
MSSTTGISPQSFSTISRATSVSGLLGVQQAGQEVITVDTVMVGSSLLRGIAKRDATVGEALHRPNTREPLRAFAVFPRFMLRPTPG